MFGGRVKIFEELKSELSPPAEKGGVPFDDAVEVECHAECAVWTDLASRTGRAFQDDGRFPDFRLK